MSLLSIMRRHKLATFAIAAVVACGVGEYIIDVNNLYHAEQTAAGRINNSCNPGDVSRESASYNEYFLWSSANKAFTVRVTGERPAQPGEKIIYKMKSSITNNLTHDFEYLSNCPAPKAG